MPMYFAGRLESANVKEYEFAATYATRLGMHEESQVLMKLASVEHEHEMYFRTKAQSHQMFPLFKRVFPWRLSTEQPDILLL